MTEPTSRRYLGAPKVPVAVVVTFDSRVRNILRNNLRVALVRIVPTIVSFEPLGVDVVDVFLSRPLDHDRATAVGLHQDMARFV